LIGLRNESTIYASAINSGTITINGHTATFYNTSAITGTQDKVLGTATVQVYHNADGSKTFSLSAKYNVNVTFSGIYYGAQSLSDTGTLNNIPRASVPTLSAGSVNVGSNVTIYTNRASSSFTHTVKYDFGNQTGTIGTGVGTSITWSVPKSLANAIPNATSGTGRIVLQTYSGSTLIGTQSVSFKALVPDTVEFRPSIASPSIVEAVSGIAEQFGAFIQKRSKLTISFTAAGIYGSSIASRVIYNSATDQRFNGQSATTDALIGSGNQSVTLTVTDSRGRQTSQIIPISVTAYTEPQITALVAQRTNDSGTVDDQGAYAQIDITASISALGNVNDKTFTLRYRKVGTTSWTEVDITPSTGYTLTGYQQVLSNMDVDSAYDIQLEVADFFGSVVRTATLPTAFTLMDFYQSGKGVAFGRVAAADGMHIGLAVNLYAPSNDAADAGFMRLRRLDGSLLAFVATSDNGTGLNIHMYSKSTGAWSGMVKIAEDGSIYTSGNIHADGGVV
jgi:hypothetical protein